MRISAGVKGRIAIVLLLIAVQLGRSQTNAVKEFELRAHPKQSSAVSSEQRVAEPLLREEMRIGENEQPEWTTHRRFPTTRVYVQRQPWEVGFEQWWRGRFKRDDSSSHLLQEELAVGLPHRLQLDLYENWTINDYGRMRHHDVATELRWAPAKWGELPLNPTLYGEWKFVDENVGADVFEVKLLLGDEFAPRWHWGFNAIYEHEVGGERATEWAFSQAISYTVVDERFSLGAEMKFAHETEKGTRGDAEIKFLLGPSVQWRPCSCAHIDLVPLVGLTHDSPRVEAFVVIGIDLWPGERARHGVAPTSLRSN